MILYDFACTNGHRFEAGVASMTADNPACPVCREATNRRPSRVQIGNRASTGPTRDQMPKSWNATRGGDAETVRHWHTLAAARDKLEERHPELGGDRRPVLAHEGIFRDKPLRQGDDIPKAVADALASGATAAHDHGPKKSHKHKHKNGSQK